MLCMQGCVIFLKDSKIAIVVNNYFMKTFDQFIEAGYQQNQPPSQHPEQQFVNSIEMLQKYLVSLKNNNDIHTDEYQPWWAH